MVAGWVLVLLSAVATGVVPIIFARLIDSLSVGKASGTSIALSLLFAYAGTQGLARVLAELGPLVFGRVEQAINRTISLRMFDHLMLLPLAEHFGRKLGSVGQILVAGLNGLRMVLQHLGYTIVPVVVEVITVTVILSQVHWYVVAIFLTTVCLYLTAFITASKRLSRPVSRITGANVDAHGVLNDVLLNIEAVKAFGAEPVVRERYDSSLAQSQSSWTRLFRARFEIGVIVAAIFTVSLATTMSVALSLVRDGAMTTGAFVMVCTYVLRVATPTQMLGAAIRDTTEAVAQMALMTDLLAGSRPHHRDQGNVDQIAPGPISVAFENIRLSYDDAREVLADVSFTIPPGETVAVVGSTGSGKSSLARLLLQLSEPDSGQIILAGHQASALSKRLRTQLLAVVPQDTVLFNATIAYNIAIGDPDASLDDIRQAASISGLAPLLASLPNGLDTLVGERGLKLSGGERQRIAIARAVLRRPRIFVFDEATSSLDPKTEQEIMGRIAQLSRGTTTLLIAHRLTTVVHAHEIIVLDHGRVAERGTHHQLLGVDGRYAALWRSQGGIHAANSIVPAAYSTKAL